MEGSRGPENQVAQAARQIAHESGKALDSIAVHGIWVAEVAWPGAPGLNLEPTGLEGCPGRFCCLE